MTVDDRALVAKQKSELMGLLTAMQPDFERALGGADAANRLFASAYLDLRRDPKLMSAAINSPRSLFEAMLTCSQLRLMPGKAPGHIFLITYGQDIQAQPGVKGWVQCGVRTGKLVPFADVVYEGDEFEFAYGTSPFLRHVPRAVNRTDDKLTHAYATTRYTNGLVTFKVLDGERIEYHRKHSKASAAYRAGRLKSPTPWETHFPEQAKKSALQEESKAWPHDDAFAILQELEAKSDDVPEYAAMQKDKAGDPNDITKVAASLQGMMDREAAEDAAKEGP